MEEVRHAVAFVEWSNSTLSTYMAEAGHSQNVLKQVVLPYFRSRAARWRFVRASVPGDVVAAARYLGGRLGIFDSAAIEMGYRLKSLKRAWAELHGFWVSKAPDAIKRLLFVGYVLAAGISGLSAYVVRDSLLVTMEKQITIYLRTMLAGRATWQPEGEGEHLRTLSAEDLRRYWGIAPLHLELRLGRLRWFQNVLAEPSHHKQRLCAVFGDLGGDSFMTITADGTLHPMANPWAAQLENDLEALAEVDEGHEAVAGLRVAGRISFRLLFQDPADFLRLDVSQLRAAAISREFPPPDFEAPDAEAPALEEHSQLAFTCPGCSCAFASFPALGVHRRTAHRVHKHLHLCVLTNACPYCSSTFSSRAVAQRHAVRAFLSGRCRVDLGAWPHEVSDVHPTVRR